MRRLLGILAAVGLTVMVTPILTAEAAAGLSVTFVDVGQGDAAIYRGPCGEIGVIDIPTGQASTVAAHLDPFPNPEVRWVAVSHYDSDHVGGVDDFLAVQDVGAVYDRGGDRNAKDTDTYRDYYDVVTSAPGVRRSVDIGNTFSLCSGPDTVLFTVISAGTDGTAVGGVAVSDENDRGLCLKVTYGAFDMASCGDISGVGDGSHSDVETPAAVAIGNVEFAKVNHHGSATSSNQTWVDTLDPAAVVIPVGENSYGHPDPAVVERWQAHSLVTRTDNGDVSLAAAATGDFSLFFAVGGVAGDFHSPADEPSTPSPAARPIDPACSFAGGFEDGFADVTSANTHEAAIDCIVYWQVTTGVRPGVYNPSGGVTREQMASFIARFVERSGGTLPSSAPDAFTDDNASAHQANINKLAAAGIVSGRTADIYAPRSVVTRAQMATFIVRALEYRINGPLNAGAADYFLDDNNTTHEANINKAAAEGITTGINGRAYNPPAPVRRDQMASFLARSLAELVDREVATIPARPAKCSLDPALESTDAACRPCPYNTSIPASSPSCQPPTPPPPPEPSCSPSYPDFCIPPPPPDLDCGDFTQKRFRTVGSDPHGLDSDGDGIACES